MLIKTFDVVVPAQGARSTPLNLNGLVDRQFSFKVSNPADKIVVEASQRDPDDAAGWQTLDDTLADGPTFPLANGWLWVRLYGQVVTTPANCACTLAGFDSRTV